MKHLHQQREENERAAQHHPHIRVYPILHLGGHEGEVLEALEQHEIDNGRDGQTTKQAHLAAQTAIAIVEREHQARQPLNERTKDERHGHTQENGQNHLQRLVRIHIVAKGRCSRRILHLEQRQGEGGSQEFENHRHGCGGGHTERIENVKQHNVGHHHGHKDAHDFIEVEHLGTENAVARNIHHAIAHHGTAEYAQGCHAHNGAKTRHLGPNRRVQEIHSIIAHAHPKVEGGKHKQEYNHSQINPFHII